MQQKNDALKAKVQTLETLPMDFTKYGALQILHFHIFENLCSKNPRPHAFDVLTKRKPAPRLFCDICDEFDKHDTEDCPIQAGEDRDDSPPPSAEANNNEKMDRKLPAPRKYCESCEGESPVYLAIL